MAVQTSPRSPLPERPEPPDAAGIGNEAVAIEEILRRLGSRLGVDFRDYRLGLVRRCIDRRMTLAGMSGRPDDYLRRLDAEDEELSALGAELLIDVTEFFRDAPSWQALADEVLPALFDEVGNHRELRAWVAATSTGAEAYTLAMVLTEAAERCGRSPQVRIFASDLQGAALEVASRGVYAAAQVEALGPQRLARFFARRADGDYQVVSELRRKVVFTEHNLLGDPPFSRMDLVSCRNVLVHLQPGAQERLLKRLHFSLRAGGVLMLGQKESTGPLAAAFTELHAEHRLYRRASEYTRHPAWRPLPGRPALAPPAGALRAQQFLLDHHAPAALLVDERGHLLRTLGPAADYLRPALGRFSAEVTEHVLPELRLLLISGLQRLRNVPGPLRFEGIQVTLADGSPRELTMHLHRLPATEGESTLMVVLDDRATRTGAAWAEVPDAARPEAPDSPEARAVQRLERERDQAREQLRATLEELEAARDTLSTGAEALQAAQSELQSVQEEMHSLHEELYALNRDHEEQMLEHAQLQVDMAALLESTQIGTIFLDAQMRVRRFTPKAARHFNLMEQDLGRPIRHLARNLEFDDFAEVVTGVLRQGEPVQRDVRDLDGGWYQVRIHPCRQEGGPVIGVILTFVNLRDLQLVSADRNRRHAELQQFASAVSHDLQRPVRTLVSFAELFDRRYGALAAREGAEAAVYLDQVRRSGQTLRAMFERILQYARVDARGQRLQRLSLQAAWEQAVQAMKVKLEATGAQLEAGPLPEVWADRTQIVWLLHELLDNALKFHGGRAPQISLRAHPAPHGTWRIELSDRGQGITEGERDAVFEMFRQGEGGGVAHGLGAGLALARRIVERHGGEIRALPREDGPGTVIVFTLHGEEPSGTAMRGAQA